MIGEGKYFLGPRGPLVLPLTEPKIRLSARKIWIITGIYAFNILRQNETICDIGNG